MAAGVEVDISDIAIISALNTPGRGVFEWRDETATEIIRVATANSPVNNPFNALHRQAIVGTYFRGWGFDRVGSNGHRVRATIYNGADHADIVEYGRRRSFSPETFSWTGHYPWGTISTHEYGTSGRQGKHVLRNATNAVMPGRCAGYAPIA